MSINDDANVFFTFFMIFILLKTCFIVSYLLISVFNIHLWVRLGTRAVGHGSGAIRPLTPISFTTHQAPYVWYWRMGGDAA